MNSVTYAQVLASDTDVSRAYHHARLYSVRNAKRLLSDAAATLGVRVLLSDDAWAQVDEAAFEAPPTLAEPQIDTRYNNLENIRLHLANEPGTSDSQEYVAFYSRCTNLAANTGGAVAYLVDPQYGIVLHKGNTERDQRINGAWFNTHASSFPIGTGRLSGAQEMEDAKRHLQTQKGLMGHASSCVVWRGRTAKCSPVDNERCYAYADYDRQRRELHTARLGAQYGSVRLKPVHVILPAPKP